MTDPWDVQTMPPHTTLADRLLAAAAAIEGLPADPLEAENAKLRWLAATVAAGWPEVARAIAGGLAPQFPPPWTVGEP